MVKMLNFSFKSGSGTNVILPLLLLNVELFLRTDLNDCILPSFGKAALVGASDEEGDLHRLFGGLRRFCCFEHREEKLVLLKGSFLMVSTFY